MNKQTMSVRGKRYTVEYKSSVISFIDIKDLAKQILWRMDRNEVLYIFSDNKWDKSYIIDDARYIDAIAIIYAPHKDC